MFFVFKCLCMSQKIMNFVFHLFPMRHNRKKRRTESKEEKK